MCKRGAPPPERHSDLYSLGITFFHALTGRLPFAATEPMEWVHSHIARNPESPKAVLDAIPSQLSAIVMKLLAKTADDRYQTAAGLEHDLRRCLAQFEGFISTLQVRASDSGDQEL